MLGCGTAAASLRRGFSSSASSLVSAWSAGNAAGLIAPGFAAATRTVGWTAACTGSTATAEAPGIGPGVASGAGAAATLGCAGGGAAGFGCALATGAGGAA